LLPIYSYIPNIYGNFQSYRCTEIIILSLSSQGDKVTLGRGLQLGGGGGGGGVYVSILNIHVSPAEGCPPVSELEVGIKLIRLKPSKLRSDIEAFGTWMGNLERQTQRKMVIKFGTGKVRRLYRSRLLKKSCKTIRHT